MFPSPIAFFVVIRLYREADHSKGDDIDVSHHQINRNTRATHSQAHATCRCVMAKIIAKNLLLDIEAYGLARM